LDKNENILKAIDELGFVLTTSAIDFSGKYLKIFIKCMFYRKREK